MLFHPQLESPPVLHLAPDHPDYLPAWTYGNLYDCCLVLEGGAMRGQFSAGVLDFFMDNGVLPSHVVGVSAGALNGYNYKAGARGRSAYLNIKYCTDWRYFSIRSFILTGNVFNVDFAYHQIPQTIEPFDYVAFDKSPIELYSVASDLTCGEADYHRLSSAVADIDWLRASASMPLLSQIVEIGDQKLLDGGICDSVPIDFARSLGCKKTIVVLTQHSDYIKSAYSLMPLMRKVYKEFPWFLERMEQRHYEYNRTYRRISRLADNGDILVLRPPAPVEVRNIEHDPKKLYQLYLVGYGEAQLRAAEIQAYLGKPC